MSDEDLAHKISTETPWWATAPIWLAAGIVGVPSMIALGAGYFIASSVTKSLSQLTVYGQSELFQINEHNNKMNHDLTVVLRFIDDNLKVQYQTCLHASQTDKEKLACVQPGTRERDYGMTVK